MKDTSPRPWKHYRDEEKQNEWVLDSNSVCILSEDMNDTDDLPHAVRCVNLVDGLTILCKGRRKTHAGIAKELGYSFNAGYAQAMNDMLKQLGGPPDAPESPDGSTTDRPVADSSGPT